MFLPWRLSETHMGCDLNTYTFMARVHDKHQCVALNMDVINACGKLSLSINTTIILNTWACHKFKHHAQPKRLISTKRHLMCLYILNGAITI